MGRGKQKYAIKEEVKMKRMGTRLLPVLLCALLTLTACGGGSNSAASRPADNNMVSTDSAPQAPAEGEYGWALDGADTGMPEPSPEESGGGLPAGVKIIYTADVDLETKEFDQASQALDEAVKELGGWFESRSLYQGGSYRRLSCTIRVPAEQFEPLLERAGEAAHMVSRDAYSEDVSETYYDSEARLTTQRTKLERLQTLLAQAATMEDIIALESALSETELQIEYLTGSLRRYDSLVGYSTVNLQLREVYRLSTDEETPMTFGERLGSAFSTGLQRGRDNMEELVIGLAANWMTLLLLAAVIAGGVLGLRRLGRRRRKAVPPPQPAGEEKKDE
jgi:hypothetical protein